ncbi:MAG: helix-turn-helix domain-containing protein [bacterium]
MSPKDLSSVIPITSSILRKARRDVIEAFEKRFIIERLRANKGNVTAAAKEAHIQRQSFQRLMKKYGIDSSEYR